MPFRFLENVAIADAAYEAWGDTIEELFSEAARAMMEIVVDTETVGTEEERVFKLEREDVETLLYAFLSEIIFLKDTEDMLFSDFKVHIEGDHPFLLTARLYGEPLHRETHSLRSDIKAVTYYLFSVKQERGGWRATVVIDI
jgi:SHS2 domain-containing protein